MILDLILDRAPKKLPRTRIIKKVLSKILNLIIILFLNLLIFSNVKWLRTKKILWEVKGRALIKQLYFMGLILSVSVFIQLLHTICYFLLPSHSNASCCKSKWCDRERIKLTLLLFSFIHSSIVPLFSVRYIALFCFL